ncbi:FMN-dependent NADH-azoreductase [Burkholderia lata]|uniref:FMN dependent NADH:quinone oxidoreductase n=1 Tax=Burkholderia lata (strain ATCC 17760 / DSM 23089 / LMG 22485 / NCIMB 9086 / R18194 / 383) TaxID=482957 RepID=A0A6P2TAF1_BURL3|nr:NAD(P)H-dependent oxidoreductase [Burkholderia lata]VWC53234.1 FMN-dependent NADH-azoreductase 3 [Burkholderia lata]
MFKLLQIDSSPMGDTSISRRLTQEYARNWLRAHPDGRVVERDLCRIAMPPIDAAWIAANCTPPDRRTGQQNEMLALSTTFTTELRAADEYVIGVPMHNWGPSANLKLWLDHIVRQGETVEATPSGPRGLLGGRRATFVIAAGWRYGPDAERARCNFLEPWLRTLFGYLGVEDMRFVTADGAADVFTGKADSAAFLAPHVDAVRALFA